MHFLLALLSSVVLAKDVLCNMAKVIATSTSADQCESEFKKAFQTKPLKDCFGGTPGYAVFLEQLKRCHSRVLDLELDKRLLALKKTDKTQFKKEMALQAAYNRIAFNADDEGAGTGAGAREDESRIESMLYRSRQALAINERRLKIPSSGKVTAECQKMASVRLGDFAKEFCSTMPDDVWDGRKPSDCPTAVALDIALSTGAIALCGAGTSINRSNDWYVPGDD